MEVSRFVFRCCQLDFADVVGDLEEAIIGEETNSFLRQPLQEFESESRNACAGRETRSARSLLRIFQSVCYNDGQRMPVFEVAGSAAYVSADRK